MGKGEPLMPLLYTFAVVFIVIWVLGLFIPIVVATVGGLIHLALVIAVVLFVIGLIRGRSMN